MMNSKRLRKNKQGRKLIDKTCAKRILDQFLMCFDGLDDFKYSLLSPCRNSTIHFSSIIIRILFGSSIKDVQVKAGVPKTGQWEGRGRAILDVQRVHGKFLLFLKLFEKFSSLNYRKHHLLQSIHQL